MSKKYHIVYADPAWLFKTWSPKGDGRSASKHYDCLSIEEIQKLPVQRITEDDAVCLLWVTFPLLKEGIATMEAWGFQYKTVGFTWVKRNKKSDGYFVGMGYHTRCLRYDTETYLLDEAKQEVYRVDIEFLKGKDISQYKIWSNDGWKRILDFVDVGVQDTYKIETKETELYFSEHHKHIFSQPPLLKSKGLWSLQAK